ncbi:Ig-like domain-containing protein [Pseudomonas sp. G34]|uniref:Ig-like domain-containing protein n=1 Tax=Pseudomonas sp. G34 TaxID=3059083 RepID=UPI002806B8B7|nr:Ig-like domain-containing protein [Pseudomonas sp. G34]MDQ7986247.1 Ig-like domain-containing protein [Pseudomonas sp. G34]
MDMLRMSTSPRSRCAVRRKVSLLGLLFGLVLSGWAVTAQAFFSLGMIPGLYVPQTYYKHGAVYTRTLVPGPSGRPVYVEYNSSGKEAREIGEAVGAFERAQVMSGDTYRALLKRKSDTLERYPSGEVLTAAAYRGKTFKTVTGETISKPNLDEGMLTVIVRAQKELFTTDGKDLVLLQLPLKDGVTPDTASKSLLLSKEGDILAQTANAIGFRVGFFGKDGQVSDTMSRDRDAQIYGPMAGVGVTLGGYIPGGYGVTDSNGKYSMNYFLPSCPGFVFEYTTPAFLELQYKRFNPRGGSYMPYYMTRQDYDVCNGLGVYSLSAAMVIATAATPIKRPMDFPVDLMVIDGAAAVKGAKVGDSTAYSAETSDRARTLQEKYDFDGDEKPEFVVPGKKVTKQVEGKPKEVFVATSVEEAELQGIYLSSRYDSAPTNTEETAPDFTRLIDTAADFKDRGLLESITTEDLKDTDIYVFRESNGQLVAERRGLHENELYKTYSGVDNGQGAFRFTIQLRGSAENFYSVAGRTGEANFTKWQSAGGFKEEFQKRTANHLKAGEQVRIIAINRPTGYIGSKTFQLQSSLSGNLINLNSQQIQMGPPNLKIWAERKSKIESGMTKGDEKKQLIGNEGAGLGSDISIAIYSDWRDADGSPLPEELADYGYTGRLAKIVAANQLAPVGANSLSQFQIKPGQQVQVIQLPEKVLAKQHLYLQVAGQPENRNPDFSSEGAGKGILKYRPTHYVPVLVPLHDEETTELSRQAYRKADREHPELNLKKPEPIYAWKYRPEMQFSLYELNVKEIRTVDAQGVSTDISHASQPHIDGANDYVGILYNLIKSSFGTLDSWSYQGERNLVLAFGEEEIKATIGASQEIRFENIGHLGGLSPDDYLSLRLYANNDTANTLWEFAFGSDLLGQAPTDYISVDGRSVDLVTYLPLQPDEQNLKHVKVHWSVTGGGQLTNSVTDSQYGIFHNTLTATTVAGTKHTVTAKVIESQDERVPVGTELKIGPMTVVAGAPTRIELSSDSSELLSSGVDKATLTGKVYDQYNNPVQEGTPVSWQTGYSGQLEKATTSVDAQGQITADYRVGLETLPTDITLSTGGLSSTTTINKKELDYSISLSSRNFIPGTSGTLTVTLNQAPQEAISVAWSNTAGLIFGPESFEGTTAQAQFRIDEETSSSGHVSVNIGGVVKTLNYNIAPADPEGSIRFDYAAIATGEQSAYEVETLRGSELQAVVKSTNATVYGKPNTTVTLSAGGFFTPNQEPVALFPMAGLDLDEQGKQIALDTIGGLQAKVNGDVAWDESDSYLGSGSSLKFDGGHLRVSDDDTLDYNTDYFTNIRFKAASLEAGTVLLRKGSNDSSGYSLSIVDDEGVARLQARVSTDQGDFTVLSSTPIESGRWYLAGLQLKGGVLILGVGSVRDSVLAPGVPKNSGFANDLVVGNGFRGNINELKLGQIHDSRGSLVLIDGVTEKQITFDKDGKARVSISGGTAKLNTLGSRVGFTITSDSTVAQRETKELRYRSVISRLTLFGNPVEKSYAQGVVNANTHEGGIAVVDGQALAEAIEMLKKMGKPALEALETAAQFLFEMTSISDVWQLTKATYLWMHGRFDEVDKIELAFAGIGVTLTLVTVAVSVGSGGVGAPGSIAAMISVKGALTVLKKTLKEIFISDPGQILRIGGTAARWSFDLVAKILGKQGGREEAIKQLVDFKDVFVELITNGTTAAWELLKAVGGGIEGFKAFLRLRKARNAPCLIPGSASLTYERVYARLTPLSQSVARAYAAPACPSLYATTEEVVKRVGLNTEQAEAMTAIAKKMTGKADDYSDALRMSGDTFEVVAGFVKNGQGAQVLKFLENMQDAAIKSKMGGFQFEKMSQILPDGNTPFDLLMDAMKHIPEANRGAAFNQLATQNVGNIRGVYGEAVMFKRMQSSPDLLRETPGDGFVRVNKPDTLKVGKPVPMGENGTLKQGIDAEGRFLEGNTSSGGPLFIEVKNYTSLYKLDNLREQVRKHFDTKIIEARNDSLDGWAGGKPHLHFEWMGDGFSREISLANRKKAVLDICDQYVKGALAFVVPAFDCKKDITFYVVEELIDPLTSKGI